MFAVEQASQYARKYATAFEAKQPTIDLTLFILKEFYKDPLVAGRKPSIVAAVAFYGAGVLTGEADEKILNRRKISQHGLYTLANISDIGFRRNYNEIKELVQKPEFTEKLPENLQNTVRTRLPYLLRPYLR